MKSRVRHTIAVVALVLVWSPAGCNDEETPLGLGTMVKACMVLDACGEVWSATECLWDYEQAVLEAPSSVLSTFNEYMTCVANAQSCMHVMQCRPSECTDFTPYCESNSLVQCLNGSLVKVPCVEYGHGAQCFVDDGGYGVCGDRTCTDAQEGSWCEGDHANDCADGVLRRTDCTVSPYYVDGACYDGYCQPRREQGCDPTAMQEYCEGSTLVSCSWEGFIIRNSCDILPFHSQCVPLPEGAACVMEGPLCESTVTGCVGNTVRICDDTVLLFDCAEIGATCEYDGYEWPRCVYASSY